MGKYEKNTVGRQIGRSVKGEHWYNQMMQEKAADELGIPSERSINLVFGIICLLLAALMGFIGFVIFN